jgi:hypothetical protein
MRVVALLTMSEKKAPSVAVLTVVIIHYKPPLKLEIMHENDHQYRLRGLN